MMPKLLGKRKSAAALLPKTLSKTKRPLPKSDSSRMTFVVATGGTALAKFYYVPLEPFMASDFGKMESKNVIIDLQDEPAREKDALFKNKLDMLLRTKGVELAYEMNEENELVQHSKEKILPSRFFWVVLW
jgi:hypothetical protein